MLSGQGHGCSSPCHGVHGWERAWHDGGHEGGKDGRGSRARRAWTLTALVEPSPALGPVLRHTHCPSLVPSLVGEGGRGGRSRRESASGASAHGHREEARGIASPTSPGPQPPSRGELLTCSVERLLMAVSAIPANWD